MPVRQCVIVSTLLPHIRGRGGGVNFPRVGAAVASPLSSEGGALGRANLPSYDADSVHSACAAGASAESLFTLYESVPDAVESTGTEASATAPEVKTPDEVPPCLQ